MNEEIKFKLSLDPDYIEKSKKSICKNCVYSRKFNGEFYECMKSMNAYFEVEFKREGVFHSQIIKCTEYTEEIWVVTPNLGALRVQ